MYRTKYFSTGHKTAQTNNQVIFVEYLRQRLQLIVLVLLSLKSQSLLTTLSVKCRFSVSVVLVVAYFQRALHYSFWVNLVRQCAATYLQTLLCGTRLDKVSAIVAVDSEDQSKHCDTIDSHALYAASS